MQLILLLMIFTVLLPQNVIDLGETVIQFVTFDFTLGQAEETLQSIFNFKESDPINAIFNDAGYSTSNFILGAGSLLFLLAGFAIFVLLKFILNLVTKNCDQNCFTKVMRKKIHYNLIIVRFLLEGCLELSLLATISLLNSDNWDYESIQETISQILAISIVVILVLLIFYISRAAYKIRFNE